jgi:receptor expression-enhancing protein 1/2/3/4
LPFYWEVKTLFLLYLSLPQTQVRFLKRFASSLFRQPLHFQGSTYIYQTYLHPFLAKNEASLDAAIVAMQSNALAFIQAKLTDLFNYIARSAGAAGQQNAAGAPPGSAPNPAAWQSTAASLWNTYGASVINSLNPGAAAAAAPGTPNATTPNQRSYPTTPNNARKSSASSTPSKEYFGSSTAVPNPPFPTPQHYQQ